jgi:hypothetical protein
MAKFNEDVIVRIMEKLTVTLFETANAVLTEVANDPSIGKDDYDAALFLTYDAYYKGIIEELDPEFVKEALALLDD